jgi:amino acid transporter
MIGKSKWFKRRKYGGWGITPKTKEGWIYLLFIIFPFIVFHMLPFWSNITRIVVTSIWLFILFVDVTDIMINLKRDEREKLHEAIAERNALWVIVLILVVGLLYYIIDSGLKQQTHIPPFIVTALVIGALVKTISNIYLDKHN